MITTVYATGNPIRITLSEEILQPARSHLLGPRNWCRLYATLVFAILHSDEIKFGKHDLDITSVEVGVQKIAVCVMIPLDSTGQDLRDVEAKLSARAKSAVCKFLQETEDTKKT